MSSTAANDPNGVTAVGWVDNQVGIFTPDNLFRGHAVTAAQSVIAYAYIGDTDLSGYVDIADYNTVSGNYGMTGYGVEWVDGDVAQEGAVDNVDFGDVSNNYNLPPLW